jgi:riboflavin synthase
MFTGIITATGSVASIAVNESCHRFRIETGLDLSDAQVGESIAVNGCCLTVVELVSKGFEVDVAKESLAVTTLGSFQEGETVNLERALRLSDRLGGHWVQGHVDGIGTLEAKEPADEGELWRISFPKGLRRYMVKKGSITIDGVSLTLNEVGDDFLEVFLIPHTLQETHFKGKALGASLNLEVDILAKYIESLAPQNDCH